MLGFQLPSALASMANAKGCLELVCHNIWLAPCWLFLVGPAVQFSGSMFLKGGWFFYDSAHASHAEKEEVVVLLSCLLVSQMHLDS